MAAPPNPTLGSKVDEMKVDDFGYGLDVQIDQYANLVRMRRTERTAPGVARRVDE